MIERDALIAAVQAAPDDDAVRLVFADWCEEHGDAARAEFVRGQYEFEAMGVGDPRRAALEDRLDDLLAENEQEWLGPAAEVSSWEWRRGFVEAVGLGADPTLEPARAQFERHPVRAAAFVSVRPNLHELARSPFLERLERLSVPIGADPFPESLALPRLAGLRELDVSEGSGGGMLAVLAGGTAFRLRAARVASVTEADAAALLTAARLAGVEDVGAPGGIDPAALEALLRTPERWTGLDLGYAALSEFQLAGLAWCGRLRSLGVRWPEGESLALPPSLRRLHLWAADDEWPPPGVLARALRGVRLESLRYVWQPFDGRAEPEDWEGLNELLSALPGPVLDLTLTGFDPDPLPELARLPLGNLRRLEVRLCPPSDAGLDALIGCDDLTGLRSLETQVEWSSEQVRRLADAPLLARLAELRLHAPDAGDAGAIALLASPRLRRLRSLWMYAGGLGPATAEALASWPGLRRLRRLTLYPSFQLPPETMEPLREHFGCRLTY